MRVACHQPLNYRERLRPTPTFRRERVLPLATSCSRAWPAMTTSTWAFASRTLPTERQPDMLLLMSGSFVHKIIIAGCRCFASLLPSGPHQEGHHAE